MPGPNSGPFRLSDVLAEEFDAITRGRLVPDVSGVPVRLPEAVRRLRGHLLSVEDREARKTEAAEHGSRKWIYSYAHRLDFAALCLSGGGIRSASFSLGVIQGLAEAKLLDKFNYLSTVSGGGYIGSWLSAWLYWNPKRGKNSGDVLKALKPERDPADEEPPPVRHLREYSSYLTPKAGLVSGDFWAAVAIIFRNLLLNWLILVPLIALPVIAVKLIAALIQTSEFLPAETVFPVACICLALTAVSLGYKLLRLYQLRSLALPGREQSTFLKCSLVPAVIAGFCYAWIIGPHGLLKRALGSGS